MGPDLARWRLRDRCLRVATYFRVMRLGETARRRARLSALRGRFQAWAVSFMRVTAERKRQSAHEQASQRQRTQRDERVCASTRMRMTAVDVYREERRNVRGGQAVALVRRRKRIPTLLDTEVGMRLYGNMREVARRCVEERREVYDG